MSTLDQALFQVQAIHHIHADQCLCGFKSHVSRDRTKHIMDAALVAAKPFLMAQAWDEGWDAMADFDHRQAGPYPTNPYRSEQ